MILKKLEIQGFKSFADRTEVLFSPGVIAVVGPNGSGKSNISDAILWVLGEQNVRTLRGQKSQDVIFAGTDKRRPVGMAEVSLTIDNTSGRLPLDFAEVTVTRRAYRSGESEFFINKTACRLKDIYELFLDTGVGREAYSIVSQGEMDAVLSARPEDRRALFDEAAGIKKYRHRKKEAERKLESTDGNLHRVNDIISELHSQIEPMAEQAEVAKRYIELAARLQEIEVEILVNDIQRFTGELAKVRQEKDGDEEAVAESDLLLESLEAERTELSGKLSEADAEVELFQAIHQEALTHAERTESQLALANERHAASKSAELRLSTEIATLEERISQIRNQTIDVSSERESLDSEESELTGQYQSKSTELRGLQDQITGIEREANDQKVNYIELAKRLATQRNELANISSRIESLRSLLERRSTELAEAEGAHVKAVAELESSQTALEQAKVDLAEIRESVAGTRNLLDEKRIAIRNATAELTQLGRTIVDKQSRLKTLREMEDAKEGYFLGVRSVNAAVKSGALSGSFAVVADVIKVPQGFETAYEVALGGSLQDIITDSEREAKSAIDFLKRNRSGRATFLPLNMMRHSQSPNLRSLVGRNGILGLGNELIDFDPKYSPAIDSLLAKVLVAEDIDSALAASKSAIGWSKIVTLDGELVFPSGAMTGGHAPGKTTNILGRKQEIDALSSEVRRLKERSAADEKTLNALQDESERLTSTLATQEEADTKLRMSVLEKERRLDFAGRELKRLTREVDSLRAEKEGLQSDLLKSRETQAALSSSIDSSDAENVNLDGLMAETEKQVRCLEESCSGLGSEIGSINVSLASLKQKKLNLEQTIRNSKVAVQEMTAEIARKQEQVKSAVQEITGTEGRRSELERELAKARTSCREVHEKAEALRKVKQGLVNAGNHLNDRIRESSRQREELTQRIHAAELKEARLDTQIVQSVARLLDEYDMTAEEALRYELPEERDGSAAEVLRLRREIKSMGEVNTGAVQEYTRITERYEFLSAQRQDLLDARQKLVDAIREIDESTRGVFMETFEAVDAAFRVMFSRLFGGGSTDLVLTEPDNILETGIDVIVELPGKKRQNLHLLSGGERALTAAALMFALMSVRPSPFCVMDEVDAPLDEANVERFADVIRDFAARSQMIVITHNKATMEAADVLYGVTMQEPGISKIVSVRLSDSSGTDSTPN